MQAGDVEPTRLGAAQEAVRTFLDQAPDGLRVGLIVFSGEAQVGGAADAPTTSSSATSVDEIGLFPGYGGTAIGDALAAAVELGQQAAREPHRGGQIAATARR